MRHRRSSCLPKASFRARCFFGIIGLLYATLGQAGGTAFLALMAFAFWG
jgi:hypothetical protein